MKYETCIFDLYGTLVDIHTDEDKDEVWSSMAAYFSRFGSEASAKELKAAYLKAYQSEEKQLMRNEKDRSDAFPEIRYEQVLSSMFRNWGLTISEEEVELSGRYFRKLSTQYIRLYDGAYDLLTTLRNNGQKVYLLSNAQRVFTEPELKSLGIYDLFDGILISSEVGFKKPDRRFFEALISQYRIEAGKAIMVGNDGECDIEGGANAGLSTLYIHSNISPDEPMPAADYCLEEMDLVRVKKILTQSK